LVDANLKKVTIVCVIFSIRRYLSILLISTQCLKGAQQCDFFVSSVLYGKTNQQSLFP